MHVVILLEAEGLGSPRAHKYVQGEALIGVNERLSKAPKFFKILKSDTNSKNICDS